jgi:hypothetical protein
MMFGLGSRAWKFEVDSDKNVIVSVRSETQSSSLEILWSDKLELEFAKLLLSAFFLV